MANKSDYHTVPVDLGDRSYDILVGNGLLASAGKYIKPKLASNRAIVVTDHLVEKAGHLKTLQAALDAAGIDHDEVVLPAGEATKCFSRLEDLVNALLTLNPDRKTTLIALGGGVVGDITGFAASMLLRGVPFIQVPTTLLAMVDSSVGGKTGINTASGKNLAGAFYQPQLVLADVGMLDTLPARDMNAGYAEVVKYALINNPEFFVALEDHDFHAIKGVVTSCKAKAAIVAEDEKEAGARALLNLGHTFGHALEAIMGYGEHLLHGEAVAVGMHLAFLFSVEKGLCHRGDAVRVKGHLQDVGLPVLPQDIPHSKFKASEIVAHMRNDKKNQDGKLVMILVKGIGQAFIEKDVDEGEVEAFLDKVLSGEIA